MINSDPSEIRRIKLLPKQKRFINDSETLMLGYGGGIGAGKTMAAIVKIIRRCERCPNALVLIARKDMPKLIDSILTKIWKMFPDLREKYNAEEQIINMENGARIYIRHGTDPQDYKGPDFSIIFLDQIEELTEFIFWHMVGRLRHDDGEMPQLIFTFNPNGHDWVYRIFKKNQDYLDARDLRADERMRIIETKTHENVYLPHAQFEALSIMKKHQPHLYKRLVEGSWEAAAGLVYEDFGSIHIYDPDDLSIPYNGVKVRATDFGQTNQNFTTLWYIDEDYNHYCYREHTICGEDATIQNIAESVLSASAYYNPVTKQNEEEDYIYSFLDPWSGFSQTRDNNGLRCTVSDLFAEYGLYYQPATRNKKAAVAHVRNLMRIDPKHKNPFTEELGAPHLYISKACPELSEQTRNLKWQQLPARLEGYRNQPEEIQKINDHGPDSMWMALASRPFVEIDNGFKIKPGTFAAAALAKQRIDLNVSMNQEEFDELFYGSNKPAYAYRN